MIVIIDYGRGNLKSVYNAMKRIGCDVEISSDPIKLQKAKGLILPGVGAFDDCMNTLENTGLIPVIKEEVKKGKPFLGICLGMQLLFDDGYEGEYTKGLGFIKGSIKKMEEDNLRIPHIGWNNLEINKEDILLKGLKNEAYVYYVHSYCAVDVSDDNLVAYSKYGNIMIPGLVRKDNVMGAQFHPEKSGEEGLVILKNFKEIVG